ncbi:type II toxin-antitoxin system RelE/ParE family toxin [Nonlabens spongiae]|uniref:type II toxin-antitoxin system RelE/ParE family toxin n=1 Tax=Nonlabens spongiae TaxID=331648 RepID=UPI001FE7400C|nr:type II toxin-antitoxin system RelE/ParE family toxin [Nonlabens spongiae]
MDLISENPLLFQKRYRKVRLRLTERFPYAIYYQHKKFENKIIILAVLHTKQNPKISITRK